MGKQIRWKSVYFPIGEWVDENGDVVKKQGNFRCKFQGRELITVMKMAHAGASHGEPATSAEVPLFIDSVTLEPVQVNGFVEVDCSVGIEDHPNFEAFIRAFWRRIEPYKNNYSKELPDEIPAEFTTSMATASLLLSE